MAIDDSHKVIALVPAAVQTPAPPVSEVVVTGARLPDPAGDLAYSVVAVAPETLRDATELDQALESVPGFSLYRRTSSLGANPTTQGVSLRAIAGSGASRALVTLDGVPQNDPFGGWVIWTALPSVAVGEARIVRGAGAGPYGAGALTGVVQLYTPTAQPGEVAEVSGGELGYREAQGSFAISTGATRASLEAAGQDSGGWIPIRAGRGAVDRPLDLHSWTAAGQIERDVASGETLAARVGAYDESRGAGEINAASRASGQQASLTLARQPTKSGWGWRVQGWTSKSDLYNASATVTNDRDTSVPADIQFATPAIGWGLNTALRRDAAAVSFELGADVRGVTGESRELFSYSASLDEFLKTRKAGGQALTAGLYAEASARHGPWLFTGGVRLDAWGDFDGERVEQIRATGLATLDLRPGDQSGTLPTGRLGFRREAPFGAAWRGAAYAGFRPATLNELYRPFRVGNNVTEANPGLRPERLYGVETGLDLRHGPLSLDATVFYNRLEDAITNVTIADGPGTFTIPGVSGVSDYIAQGGALSLRENAGVVNAEGVEAEAAEAVVPDRFELRQALAYTYSIVDGGAQAPQLTGLRPALTPRTTVTGEARWMPTSVLELNVDVRYESRRYGDDLNTLVLRPSLSFDMRADYVLTHSVSVFFAADNVFDADIQTAETVGGVYSYDAPRLLRAGVRLRR